MVALSDLERFFKLFPLEGSKVPQYAFAGGSALLCWLHQKPDGRNHHDIDVVAFDRSFPSSLNKQNQFFRGGLTTNGLVGPSQQNSIPLQIIYGHYFDADNIPTLGDVRMFRTETTWLPVLSSEFIAVSKLTYPNVHRPYDFQDILSLNQNHCLQDFEYLSNLLAKTSLNRVIDLSHILNLRQERDLQEMMKSIHRELTKPFLYWDDVNVSILDALQVYILLDTEHELLGLSVEWQNFVNSFLAKTSFDGYAFQVAKLGLYLLVANITRVQNLNTIQDDIGFQEALTNAILLMSSNQPTLWLILAKTVFLSLRYLIQIENSSGCYFDHIWTPAILTHIIRRVFSKGSSRFEILAAIKMVLRELQMGKVSAMDCSRVLCDQLTTATIRHNVPLNQ
jgi:hypothetical protein